MSSVGEQGFISHDRSAARNDGWSSLFDHRGHFLNGASEHRPGTARINYSSGHGSHMPATGDRKALVLSDLLTGVYFFIELAVGFWTGSVAVISDAFHTFSAVGGVLIALFAQRLGQRGATLDYTCFGKPRWQTFLDAIPITREKTIAA